jgi:single-strand DNA-binding protein
MSYTPNGVAVTRLYLAIKRIERTDLKEREVVNFVPVLVLEQLAEECNTYLRKNMEVYVEGELIIRSYSGRDRLRHTVVEVAASKVSLPDGTPFYDAYEEILKISTPEQENNIFGL